MFNNRFQIIIGCLICLFFAVPSQAITLKDKRVSINISAVDNDKVEESYQVTINAPKLTLKKLFFIPDPARLVIDLRGFSFSKNHKLTLNNKIIRAVRTGNHPHNTRIVLDLNKDFSPTYTYTETPTSLKLTIIKASKNIVEESAGITTTGSVVDTLSSIPTISLTPSLSPSVTTEETMTPQVTNTMENIPSPTLEKKSEITPVIKETTIITAVPTITEAAVQNTTPVDVKKSDSEVELLSPTPTETVTVSEEMPSVKPSTQSTNTTIETIIEKAAETALESVTASDEVKTVDSISEASPTLGETAEERVTASIVPQDKEDISRLTSIDFVSSADGERQLSFSVIHRTRFSLSQRSDKEYILSVPNCRVDGKHLLLPYFAPQDYLGFSLVRVEEAGDDINIYISIDKNVELTAIPANDKIIIRKVN